MPLEWIAVLGWLMAFANAAATIYWVRVARRARLRCVDARAQRDQAAVARASALAELEGANAELKGVYSVVEELRRAEAERARRARIQNVAELVPALGRNARASDDSAGFCRKALRAQIAWFNDCPAILPFRDLICRSELDAEVRHTMACEVYARAILESALAWHLDGTNPRSDGAVLRLLREALGDEFAERVHLDVEARGVVFDSQPSPAQPPAQA